MTGELRKRKMLPGKMILWAIVLFAAVFLLLPVRGSAKKKVKIKVPKTRFICNVGYVGQIKARVKTSPKKLKKKIKLKFKSSNPKVLIVNGKGQFKAVASGLTVVTVKAVRKKKTLAKKKIIIAVNERRPKKKGNSKKGKKGSYFTLTKTKIICDVGDAGKIKTKYRKKNIELKYESSNTEVLTVNKKGKYKAVAPGIANVTVKAVKGNKTVAKKKVKIAINGLCISDLAMESGFYIYKGRTYLPGTLPINIEKKLCLTQEDLKVYMQKYLAVYQKKISDPVEAGLTAIMNFSAYHMKAKAVPEGKSPRDKTEIFFFDGAILGTVTDGQTIWVSLLRDHKGACVYYSSLFSYLCYLSGVPCMQVEDEGHDWNLIYDPRTNAYYNLENHNLMVTRESHFVAPPITKKTAKIIDGKIIHETYTFPQAKMPVKKISNMGRSVSEVCPLLMTEKKGNQFRVFFKKLRKGSVPTFSDGKKVKASQIIYRNMEYDFRNERVVPKFNEANKALHKDLKNILPK